MALPTRVSESTRRLNPHLFGHTATLAAAPIPSSTAKPRIRQKAGPTLNKTEAAFLAHLRAHYPDARIEAHAIALRIANGCVYWPDILVTGIAGEPKVWEVKGGHLWDDAIVKLKVAARAFPWLEFWLASPVDRTLSAWNCQRIFA